MLRKTLAGLVIVVPLLAGCIGMPVTTMFKFRTMNPLEVDPAQLKVVIRADERIRIVEDGVHISLEFDAEDGSLHIDHTYDVETRRNPILTLKLFNDKKPGESITVLQLADVDARKLIGVQSQLRPYADNHRGGTLSFGVDISGVCVHTPIPAGKVLVDIFMQASDNDGFFAVTRDLDLRSGRTGVDKVLESFAMCAENSVVSNHDDS